MAEGGNEAGGWLEISRVCLNACVHELIIKQCGVCGRSGRAGGIP